MDDLENSEIMEAYNRLSLLLDQQKTPLETEINDPIQPQTPPKKSIQNKIDILANLIEVDQNQTNEIRRESNNFAFLNESTHSANMQHSFGVDSGDPYKTNPREINSKNFLPHVDDLITVLTKNNLVSNDANPNSDKRINPETAYFACREEQPCERVIPNMPPFKPRKYDPFAVFKKASPGEFKKTLERFLYFERLKNEKIESIKKDLEESEKKEIKLKPKINAESHKLAGQRNKPLHMRTNDILSARKEKQKVLKDQLHMEKQMKDPSPKYQPDLVWTQNNRVYSSAKKHRNPEEFIKDVENWYKKRNDKIQASQIKSLKDDYQSMPFHPKINKKWKNLTVNLDEGQPIEERLLEVGKQYKEREQKKMISATPSFTPKINKKSYKLAERKDESKSPNPNDFHSVSVERKPRPSFLENTISYSSKGKEKFQKSSDERDMKYRSSQSNDESFFERNRKKHKINVVEYNDANKFVVEKLKSSKKQPKIMLKIN